MDSNMKYAEYKIVAKNEDGSPVCVCPECGHIQRVQVQQMRRILFQVDCVNSECKNHLHTAYIPEDELTEVV